MTGDTAPVRRHWDAVDDVVAVALRILGPSFYGTPFEAIRAAADHVAAHGLKSRAHWFADLLMDLASHACIDDEWCFLCAQQAQQERDRWPGSRQVVFVFGDRAGGWRE
jgi:hypothetical protein